MCIRILFDLYNIIYEYQFFITVEYKNSVMWESLLVWRFQKNQGLQENRRHTQA